MLVLLLALAALPFLIDANQFRPTLESKLTQALGRVVKVGNLKLALLSGGVTADDLSIADDPAFSQTPFVQAKSLSVAISLAPLIFSRKLIVTGLAIDQPQIWLLQSPAGDWNFSKMGVSAPPKPAVPASQPAGSSRLDLSVKLVKITNGRFTLGRTGGHLKPLVLEKVNAELHDFASAGAFPFSISMTVAGGGSIRLDGKAGPVDQTDVALTPATLALKIDSLDLAGSGLNEMAPGVAGLVSFDGSGQSSVAGIEVKGRLKITKWKLSAKATPAKRNLELDFHVAHNLKKKAGALQQADIHMGSAVARLTGTYTSQDESMAVKMKLVGSNMPVAELAAMLPPMGIVLPNGTSLQGGAAEVQASMEGPVDRLVTTGSVNVTKTRLAGFDLSSKLSGIEKLAGIKSGPDAEIEVLSSNVKVAPEGMSADDVKLVLPAVGSLVGGGTVSPENTLNFRMQAAVRTSGLATILNNEPVPFTVEGTCAEPVFHPDIKAVVKGEFKGVGKATEGLFKGLLGGKK